MAPRKSQQKKGGNPRPKAKVPPTPVSANGEHSESIDKDSKSKSQPTSPYLTPPTSPSTPTVGLPPSMDAITSKLQKLGTEPSADDAATPTPPPDTDHAETTGSEEEQTGLDPTQSDELTTKSKPQAPLPSADGENTPSDGQKTVEEETKESGGEQPTKDGHQEEGHVQTQPVQQSPDKTEQQTNEETSNKQDHALAKQTQTLAEELPGEPLPLPELHDVHQENEDATDDSNAESQESQDSGTQNEGSSEGQQGIETTPESQTQKSQQHSSELVTQAQQDQTEDLIDFGHDEHDAGDVKVDQESTDGHTHEAVHEGGAEGENQQLKLDSLHVEEDQATNVTESTGAGAEIQIAENTHELGQGGQQQVPENQRPEAEPGRVAEKGQQLEEQEVGDEREHAPDGGQAEADPLPLNVAGDGQAREDDQEPVNSDPQPNSGPEHTSNTDQLEQEQEHLESERPVEAQQEAIEPDEQVGAGLENVVEGEQQAEEQDAVDSGQQTEEDQEYVGEGGEHLEGYGPADSHPQVNPEPSSEGNGQLVKDEVEQTKAAGDQQPGDLQEKPEANVTDQELESDNEEGTITIEPPADDPVAQSPQEYLSNDPKNPPEKEDTQVEEHTLVGDQDDNELNPQTTENGPKDDFEQQVQYQDDLFGDEEQDTMYEPELEDIQEEMAEVADEMETLRAGTLLDISAKEVASRDLLAMADLFASMKSTLAMMSSAFERLGSQTEKMTALGLDVKAAEQLQRIKSTLEAQIARHKAEVETVKSTLRAKVKEALEAKIRDHLHDVIKGSVQNTIEERVRQDLSEQIPEDLRQQVISHKRQILEVKTSLHNSEARRYNALQTIPTLNAPLRPLLRPLPTPEQSPYPISMSRSSSMSHSNLATPTTAFPQVPAPTPIRRMGSNSFRPPPSDTVPPSPSPFFPRDMTTLFALNPEETKRLLREYGLTSTVASPAVEHPVRPRGLSIVNEDAAEEEDPDVHARDLNTFMAHIGVPFLMIPAPKEKHNESAPLSSRSRRKLLTPLIIK